MAGWVRPVLAVLVAVQLWSAMSSSFTSGATVVKVAALLCGLLAVFGLPSIPLRTLVWTSISVSLALLARFGMTAAASGLAAVWRPLVWLAATTVALVLSAPWRANAPHLSARPTTGPAVAAVALVCGAALLVGPRAAGMFDTGSTIGETVDASGNHPGNPLDSTSTLDMTTRPQLSDRVVMTVVSPVASFWRSEVFDVWDGVRWSRSDGRSGRLLGEDGTVLPSPEDLAGNNGEPVESEFRIEAGYATALPAPPSAVRFEVDGGGHQLAQRTDGTVVAVNRPLGRGATYRVTSRELPIDAAELAELGTRRVPTGVSARYAQPPVATQRTIELAQRVTEGVDSNYDAVLALESWMGDNTTYDLEAPLSPSGVDVVDHFLFESRLGWCEQIASSLVVMGRAVGIPARLATGYVPGEWDPLAGRFIVREQHAHSWAEVWFPEVGWVPFDPTAEVPLSGTTGAVVATGVNGSADAVGGLMLVVALGLLGGPPLARGLREAAVRLTERRRRRSLVRTRWDVAEEAAIEEEGARWLGRERAPAETLGDFAQRAVSEKGPQDLIARAAAVERCRYGPESRVPVGRT